MYFDVKETLLTDYIIGLYTTDGENNLYYHDAELANGAKDKGYRYSGANPNNYVCFQTNDDVCSEDNLYQIIGLYYNPEKSEYNVKLSANNIFGVSFDLSNNFRNSLLDLINNTLNNDYLNTISEISSKIANYTWHLNEVTYPYSANATQSRDILTLYWISGNSWMITDTDSGVRLDSARAVFYLNSNVKYISGDGSKTKPYIIN